MEIIGKTTDNKLVVTGLFQMFDTQGLPLVLIWELCNQKNLMPSWIDFYKEAKNAGWKHETILNRMSNSLVDIYGIAFRDEIISRIEFIASDESLSKTYFG